MKKGLLIIPMTLLLVVGCKDEEKVFKNEMLDASSYEVNYTINTNLNGNLEDYNIFFDYNTDNTYISINNKTEYYENMEEYYITNSTLETVKEDDIDIREEIIEEIPFKLDFNFITNYEDGTHSYEMSEEEFLKLMPDYLKNMGVDTVKLNVTMKDGYVTNINATIKYNIAGHMGDMNYNVVISNVNTNEEVKTIGDKLEVIEEVNDFVQQLKYTCEYDSIEEVDCSTLTNEIISSFNPEIKIYDTLLFDEYVSGKVEYKNYIITITEDMVETKLESK